MFKRIILTTSLLLTQMAFAQSNTSDERIQVLAEAEIELPADQVIFNVNLSYKDYDDVKVAFNNHKKAEEALLKFLKDLKIPNKNITYSLVSFQRHNEYSPDGKSKEFFATQQNVTIKLEDLKAYPDLLIKLVNAGYTNVNTAFTSSKENDFHDTLLEKAIAQAEKKAAVLAKASDRKLGKVTRVSDSIQNDPVFRAEAMYAKADSGFISEIPQTIKKSISLNVVFELE